MKRLLSYLPVKEAKEEEREEAVGGDAPLAKEFGQSITFKFESNFLNSSQTTALNDVEGHDSLSGEEEEGSSGRISTALLAGLTKNRTSYDTTHSIATAKEQESHIYRGGGGGGGEGGGVEKYGGTWLQEQCKHCQVTGFTWQLLYQKLFDLLTTTTDEVLENDVSEQHLSKMLFECHGYHSNEYNY